jgi:hypothetical protein
MKSAIRLLLMSTLAIGPISCNRSNSPDDSVSANNQNTEREREAVRENRQAYRVPEKPANRSVDNRRAENRSETRTNNRSDQVRPAEREDRRAETVRTRSTETVPNGTAIRVTLADMISTDKNQEGDEFTAHLSEPIIVNGKVVAEKGDRVTGHVAKLDEPGRVKGKARLELVLDQIQTGGKGYKVSTEPFIAVASDNHKRDATEIAGGAAVGAAVGAIAGGGKGAAIGAVIGGGTGTTAVLLTKGKQLELEPETKVNFVLSRDVDLPMIRATNT